MWWDVIGDVLFVAAGLGMTTFVVLYAGWSRWRSTATGRHIMWFMVVGMVFTIHVTAEEFAPNVYGDQPFVQMLLSLALAVTVWRLVWQLVKTQRRERRLRLSQVTMPDNTTWSTQED